MLFLECSEKEMEERLLRRGETSGREDDTLSVIRKRFEIFKRETMPVASVFFQQGKLRKVKDSCCGTGYKKSSFCFSILDQWI